MNPTTIGSFEVGTGRDLFLICGPCVIESENHTLTVARRVRQAFEENSLSGVFKASFDKANRTSVSSYRGPGFKEGLQILQAVKQETGLPILTDVHEISQVGPTAEVCDIMQIPAFLCRQTDLLVEAGRTDRVINVKKGQFLAPWDMRYAVDKIVSGGNDRIILTERGSSFGYQNLVVDFRGLKMMQDLDCPVVLDVTHSLQLPGAAGGASGGQPQFIETLARAGAAAGVDGLFFEVHDDPEKALSDGANALHLDLLPALLKKLKAISHLVRSWS